MEYNVSDDEDSHKEQLINALHASANASSRSLPKFPEIRGLCRTCDHAHITRRQYDEMPTIRCALIRSARGMPHDVMECTEYSRRGQFSLRDMAEMAIIIDARKKAGGQYL